MNKNSPTGFISIILPTYNESENIITLIKKIGKVVEGRKEFIVVDDNSPDGTSEVVKKFAQKNRPLNVRLETRYHNPGLTNSLKRGIKLAQGEVIIWLDCDLSMPPKVIPQLLKKIEEGFDIAVGSRFVKGGGFKIDHSANHKDSPIAIILSRLMNLFIRTTLGANFKDYTSGFIAIRKKVLNKITLRGDYGEYFIDLIYKAKSKNYKITEICYICLPRKKGKSKTGTNLWQYLKRGRKYILMTFQLLFERYVLNKIP